MRDDTKLHATEILARLSFVIGAHLEAIAAGEGLSVQQVRLLGILRDREPTVNELAALLGLDKSSTSGAVARAEKRALVRRTQNVHDGRSVRVQLTAAGRALVDAASAHFDVDAERILGALTASECAVWTALSDRLLRAEADDRA